MDWRPKPTPRWSQGLILAATAARMALSVALTIVLGRVLAPAEFGFVALVGTVFALGHELTDMGTGNVAVRIAARSAAEERAALSHLLALRLALSAVAAASCAGLAAAQHGLARVAVLLGVACVLLLAHWRALEMVFVLRQRQAGASALAVGVQVAALAACAALAPASQAGAAFAAVIVVRECAAVAGVRLLATRMLGYAPRPVFARGALRPFFGRAAMVASASLAYHAQFQGGMFVVDALRPAAELGAYGAALRPVTPLLMIPWVLALPLLPVLSGLAARERAAFLRQGRGLLDIAAGFGAVVAIVTALMAGSVTRFLYGARFEGLGAAEALTWLAAPLGCAFVIAAIASVLLADRREGELLALGLGALALNAGLALALVPRFGGVGAAMATCGSIAAMTVGGLVLAARGAEGYSLDARVLPFLLPAAVLAPVLALLPGSDLTRLAVGGVLAGAALLAVLRMPGTAALRAEQDAFTLDPALDSTLVDAAA